MQSAEINMLQAIELREPLLIEGLPGLGWVGKLAAEHMVKELKAKKFAELHSPDFPPQVLIEKDFTVRMMRNEFYYHKAKGKKPDVIFLIGDHQGMTFQSHYDISSKVLDLCQKQGASRIYTLGGFGVGKIVKSPRVFGAVTDTSLMPGLKKRGVVFEKAGGNILGAAGLLLGLGRLRGMQGACLMGETHGNYIDPNSAAKVVEVINELVGLKVPVKDLEEKAKETSKLIKQFEQMQKGPQMQAVPQAVAPEEPLEYIR